MDSIHSTHKHNNYEWQNGIIYAVDLFRNKSSVVFYMKTIAYFRVA